MNSYDESNYNQSLNQETGFRQSSAIGEKVLLQQLKQTGEEGMLNEVFPEAEWLQTIPFPVEQEELDRIFTNIMSARQSKLIKISSRRWWYAACILVLVIGATFTLFLSRNLHQNKLSSAIFWQRISTEEGKMQKISLEDGSVVYVNGGSILDIPLHFTETERRMKLVQGELFIKAAPDAMRPMLIDMNGLEVKVLGTSFNLRNYANEPLASVSVASGKVAAGFTGSSSPMLLVAGQSVRWHKARHQLEPYQHQNHPSGWLQHEFSFNGESLEQVIKTLQHSYGVSIKIHDSILAKRAVKATFKAQSLNSILRILGKMGSFIISNENSIIHIYPAKPIQQKSINKRK